MIQDSPCIDPSVGQIRKQVLAVSHHQHGSGKESLCYAPAPLEGEETLPDPIKVPISRSSLTAQIDTICQSIKALTQLALLGRSRGSLAIEEAADQLAKIILPKKGTNVLLKAGRHPQLDIIQDAASEIPWEVFGERFFVCPKCGEFSELIWDPSPGPRFCSSDGSEMELCDNKLSLTRHLTHLVRGAGSTRSKGDRFLIIDDPMGDLGHQKVDPHGIVKNHLLELRKLIKTGGFELEYLRGKNATRGRVLSALSTPAIIGIYYFGHGYLPESSTESRLLLADGPLSATEVAQASPSASFVFLNACHGAKTGRNWEIEDRARSVAMSFARGDRGKVVIAPLWPVVNVQAAEMAAEFFRSAFDSKSNGEALCLARWKSLERYRSGEPHLGWMAYRYFGDPERSLPTPQSVHEVATDCEPAQSRLFDKDGQLDVEILSFEWDSALIRAVKRRMILGRCMVSPMDIFAGLVRSGDLTRHLVRTLDADPDVLYKRILRRMTTSEEKISGEFDLEDQDEQEDDEEAKKNLFKQFVVRRKDQLTAETIALLKKAEILSRETPSQADDGRIAEDHILAVLFDAARWADAAPLELPDLDKLQKARSHREETGALDENGWCLIDHLHPKAQAIIHSAHELAQQRGIFPISHRLLLAAFLQNPEGVAARALDRQGLPPDAFFDLMISSSDKKSPRTYGLGEDACGRIVLPVLSRATEIAQNKNEVTEENLFKSFCQVAFSSFKQSLRDPRVGLDLDRCEVNAAKTVDFEGMLSDEVSLIVRRAMFLARSQGHREIRSPHLFVGMMGDGTGPTGSILRRLGLKLDSLKSAILSVVRIIGPPLDEEREISYGERAQSILQNAARLTLKKGRGTLTETELLTAFFQDGGGPVGELLSQAGVSFKPKSSRRSSRATTTQSWPRGFETDDSKGDSRSDSIVEQLGVDLTDQARRGQLAPVVGRADEIETVIHTLLLTEHANPLLSGEAGVGKTAIVRGLAQRIVEGACPDSLKSKRIIEISAGSLIAGTRYHGDFEERILDVLKEAGDDTILFIDEIHSLFDTKGSSGPNAGDLLKSWLAGETGCLIGASTPGEIRQTIGRDKALMRRFQSVRVGPPSREVTKAILRALSAHFEKSHSVAIGAETLDAAIDISGRYIHDRQWPAKARDVLDQACVLAMLSQSGGTDAKPAVTPDHVLRVVSREVGIPLERITAEIKLDRETLKAQMMEKIKGQDEAVETVSSILGRLGARRLAEGPLASILFVGPPGVGKTEMAKQIAIEVFGSASALIRFDMGDFSEEHSTARLVGAPPGYVDSHRGAPLIEQLRRRPHSVLLFDDIEKAHPNVHSVLLPLLAEGTISDMDGLVADSRNTVVVMTSNLPDLSTNGAPVGFTSRSGSDAALDRSALRDGVASVLTAALTDRLDAIVPFRSLDRSSILEIARLRAERLLRKAARAVKRTITLEDGIIDWLLEQTPESQRTARGIIKIVDRTLEDVLGRIEPEERSEKKNVVEIIRDGGELRLRTGSTSESGDESRS